MFRDWWEQLQDRLMIEDVAGVNVLWEYESYDLFGFGPVWISVTLPQFMLTTAGDVRFHFRDVICDWWKEGVSFDYIQLSQH